ncbi:hypothetical protein PYCCODRAFT_404851 [Trametes coccinea BRFM310]|uniref:Uncharacterized protein n=1 Tax=Trametes coccinea (strain BRFM310) TaxID=1353009 RepID=A0A1Y2IQG3_TRAC3|nr:hypothetical protein PYCCODRAFT_404851 [Trametes coccinea BRFM310]
MLLNHPRYCCRSSLYSSPAPVEDCESSAVLAAVRKAILIHVRRLLSLPFTVWLIPCCRHLLRADCLACMLGVLRAIIGDCFATSCAQGNSGHFLADYRSVDFLRDGTDEYAPATSLNLDKANLYALLHELEVIPSQQDIVARRH